MIKKLVILLLALVISRIAVTETLPAPSPNYYVVLTWQAATDQTDPAVGYNIYSQINNTGNFNQINKAVDAQLTYTDNSVLPATSYTYYVEAVDAQGNSSNPSNSWSTTIPFIPYTPILGTVTSP